MIECDKCKAQMEQTAKLPENNTEVPGATEKQ